MKVFVFYRNTFRVFGPNPVSNREIHNSVNFAQGIDPVGVLGHRMSCEFSVGLCGHLVFFQVLIM